MKKKSPPKAGGKSKRKKSAAAKLSKADIHAMYAVIVQRMI